jgi:hypothetical protein
MGEQKTVKRIVLRGQAPGFSPLPTSSEALASVHPNIYLLSPANATGRRAKMLFNPHAEFELAHRLRTTGISLGEAFSFMSALYFRGKLAYVSTFAKSTLGVPGSLVITPSRGLLRPEMTVKLADLAEITGERIVADNPKYREPLERDLRLLSEAIGQHFRVVLLGSIATRKYIPLLLEVLGERLVVPRAFVGLGNMSRGALLLRRARERCELEYISIADALAQKTKNP